MFLEESFYLNGISPTFREIAGKFSISVKAAYDHVKALEKKGWLSCNPNQARSICLQKAPWRLQKIPLIEKDLHHIYITNNEGVSTYEFLENQRSDNYFGFYVSDQDMIRVGIVPNDFVIIDSSAPAKEGGIVAILIDETIRLRMSYPEGGGLRIVTRRIKEEDQAELISEASLLGGLIHLVRNYPNE